MSHWPHLSWQFPGFCFWDCDLHSYRARSLPKFKSKNAVCPSIVAFLLHGTQLLSALKELMAYQP